MAAQAHTLRASSTNPSPLAIQPLQTRSSSNLNDGRPTSCNLPPSNVATPTTLAALVTPNAPAVMQYDCLQHACVQTLKTEMTQQGFTNFAPIQQILNAFPALYQNYNLFQVCITHLRFVRFANTLSILQQYQTYNAAVMAANADPNLWFILQTYFQHHLTHLTIEELNHVFIGAKSADYIAKLNDPANTLAIICTLENSNTPLTKHLDLLSAKSMSVVQEVECGDALYESIYRAYANMNGSSAASNIQEQASNIMKQSKIDDIAQDVTQKALEDGLSNAVQAITRWLIA